MSPIDSYQYVFPVIAAAGEGANRELLDVCGTAFPVGGGAFLTAGHILTRALSVIAVRAFVGHTVCSRRLFRLPAAPLIHELSFACPRGLSGAPLWRVSLRSATVVGMILANEITEMTVYSEKERLVDPAGTRELVKTEALHLGLALSAQAIVSVTSNTLGGSTIGDWLRRHGKLT